ncbi:MAG: SAM-dependent methyltransferase, partial [Firmicutes bacterium]|nr:SAM-dependent methyltransferase [Bacillota bacterium]
LTVARTVLPCSCAADIGTDHAYIPIWLCQNNITTYCIAGDVSKGSAKKAADNVKAHCLENRISVRCGSGLKILDTTDKVGCIIIAGMGGMLMLDILNGGDLTNVSQLVLQPQKDIPKVRKALHAFGYKIENEYIVFEENKYYNIINAVKGSEQPYTETEYLLGKRLLEKKEPLLKDYITHEENKLYSILPLCDANRKAEIETLLEHYKEGKECL